MPVDMLPPKKHTWKALLNNMDSTVDVCIPSWKGSGGHPVLLSYAYILKLLKTTVITPDTRLDHEIKNLAPDSVKYIETLDKRITGNVNTLNEFNSLKSEY
jgi:CTP:molybdopterin cytidylyltransferase MocA